MVNENDYWDLVTHWASGSPETNADLDQDGLVSVRDILAMLDDAGCVLVTQ